MPIVYVLFPHGAPCLGHFMALCQGILSLLAWSVPVAVGHPMKAPLLNQDRTGNELQIQNDHDNWYLYKVDLKLFTEIQYSGLGSDRCHSTWHNYSLVLFILFKCSCMFLGKFVFGHWRFYFMCDGGVWKRVWMRDGGIWIHTDAYKRYIYIYLY